MRKGIRLSAAERVWKMIADLIILTLVAAYCIFVLVRRHKQKKLGGVCAGCAGCSGCGKSGCLASCQNPKGKDGKKEKRS